MKKPKLLVAEDEKSYLESLKYYFERRGYEVATVEDGHGALEAARSEEPDLIVLDVMLPGMDGFEVCRILRRELSQPILMLTARDEEVDKIVGLEVGADDYVTKLVSFRELEARVKANLRRVRILREELDVAGRSAPEGREGRNLLRFGELEVDEDRWEARRDGTALELRPKEFELLIFLARNRGIALGRSLILQRVWGWDFEGGSRTVDVHVRWLREKIEEDPAKPRRIVTVRGIGYRFDG